MCIIYSLKLPEDILLVLVDVSAQEHPKIIFIDHQKRIDSLRNNKTLLNSLNSHKNEKCFSLQRTSFATNASEIPNKYKFIIYILV